MQTYEHKKGEPLKLLSQYSGLKLYENFMKGREGEIPYSAFLAFVWRTMENEDFTEKLDEQGFWSFN